MSSDMAKCKNAPNEPYAIRVKSVSQNVYFTTLKKPLFYKGYAKKHAYFNFRRVFLFETYHNSFETISMGLKTILRLHVGGNDRVTPFFSHFSVYLACQRYAKSIQKACKFFFTLILYIPFSTIAYLVYYI